MARQRHCRRLARNGKPAASLLTPSSSEPRTPAGKARVFDARKWLRERDGLSAGGRWIRTSGSARQGDVGAVVNPIRLQGQIDGGVVQGLGQALVSSRLAGVLAAKTSPISDAQT